MAHDVEHDAEQPGLELRAAVEVSQTTVGDEKHFLVSIVERALSHSQAPQAAPDEVEVSLVNSWKIARLFHDAQPLVPIWALHGNVRLLEYEAGRSDHRC